MKTGNITVTSVTDWSPTSPILMRERLQHLLLPSTIVFVEAVPGGGKTTMINYISKHLNIRHRIFAEPEKEVCAVTTKYYRDELSLEKCNKLVTEICTRPWINAIRNHYGGATDQWLNKPIEEIYLVERLPPPFRAWIFEKSFHTDIHAEVANTIQLRKKLGYGAIHRMYMRDSIIQETIYQYPELDAFKNILVIVITLPIQKVLYNITKRGRKGENKLSPGYLAYLDSKLKRALWEFQLEKPNISTYLPNFIDDLCRKFPL